MSIVPANRGQAKALFEGVSAFYPHDDRSDNKGPGGAYSHLAIEFAATEAEQYCDWYRFINENLGAGVVGVPVETVGASYALGTILTITGYNPATSNFTVDKANTADPTKPPQLVVNEIIGFSSTGWAYTTPLVEGIDTSTAASAGSLAYLGVSGAFQFSAPSGAGDHAFKVGACTIKHAGSGAIQFFPPAPTNLASGSSGSGPAGQTLVVGVSAYNCGGESSYADIWFTDQTGTRYSGTNNLYFLVWLADTKDTWLTANALIPWTADTGVGAGTVMCGFASDSTDPGKAYHFMTLPGGLSPTVGRVVFGTISWSGYGYSACVNASLGGACGSSSPDQIYYTP
jgi:hypothetical protein